MAADAAAKAGTGSVAALAEALAAMPAGASEEFGALARRAEAAIGLHPEVLLLVDASGDCSALVAAAGSRFAEAAGRAVGRQVGELFAPDAAEAVGAALREARQDAALRRFSCVEPAATGLRWYEACVALTGPQLGAALVLALRESGAGHHGAAQPAQGELLLADVFSSIQDGISVLDTDLTIVRVNRTMERWYATSMPVVGRKCYEAYHGRAAPCDDCPTVRSLNTGRTERLVVPGLPGSAAEWVEVFSFPVRHRATGRTAGVVEFVRDITERRRADEQRERLEERLHQSEKMQAIGQMAGGIAHDFNNQLTGIMGCADMLRMSLTHDKELSSYVDMIASAARRAAELTGQLLAFARKGKYLFGPVDVHTVVGDVVALLKHTADKRVRIVRRLHADPAVTRGDRTLLHNALLNVALNACDAMPQGGELAFATAIAELDEASCRADPFAVAPGRYLRLSVSDQGVGMDRDTLAHLFEPFFTTKEKGKGTGMGLAAVYGTVRDHHGSVRVESTPGKGATFHLYLPLWANAPTLQSTAEAAPQVTPGEGCVLVVDDEEIVRATAAGMLQRLGYTTLTCAAGAEAVERYREHWHDIDLVLLDMMMPGLSGADTFAQLRGVNPAARVVLTSGYSRSAAVEALIKAGAAGFVSKPFQLAELSRAMAEAAGGSGA